MSDRKTPTRPLPNLKEMDTAPFWRGTAAGEFRYQQCANCDTVIWHPRAHCTGCVNGADTIPSGRPQATRRGDRALLLVAWLLALALIVPQVQPIALAAIRDGIVFDNDDAMRLVQLREWLSGPQISSVVLRQQITGMSLQAGPAGSRETPTANHLEAWDGVTDR